MKVFVSSLVVLALFIIVIPSPGDAKVKCPKLRRCYTKTYGIDDNDSDSVECDDECAAWVCVRSGVGYVGQGCKGDTNVCKESKNQDEPFYEDKTSCYETCKPAVNDFRCTSVKLHDCHLNINKTVTASGECKPSKDGSKTGVLAVGGMLLLSWIFGRF